MLTHLMDLTSTRSFPPAAERSAETWLEDFTRCAAEDDARPELPESFPATLRAELSNTRRDVFLSDRIAVTLFVPHFNKLNKQLEARNIAARWTLFHLAGPGDAVIYRWRRVAPEQVRAFEANGELSVHTALRHVLIRFPAAALFYLLLWRSYSAGSPALYAATAAALALYLVLRWRLPLKPRPAA